MLLGNKVRTTLKKQRAPAPADLRWMARARELAQEAARHGDVPVGAVLVDATGKEVGVGWNRREERHDPTAHAEVEALRSSFGGGWRREGTTLYVTLEPCPMCMGALLLARVPRLVFGAFDPKAGAARSLYRLGEDSRLNHRLEVVPGVDAEACGQQLTDFFSTLRGPRPRT
jgi:tRNA(adenine34) deaminase